jgi:hypothetical protein
MNPDRMTLIVDTNTGAGFVSRLYPGFLCKERSGKW